ncbi:MAG: inositol monophosphatase family protein [Anaerolineae bacterium]|nr:inositol monophosphatase family protein [Anaerolineae bacterium]
MEFLSKEYATIREAARRAASLCMAVRRDMLDKLDSMEKTGREPVTVADYGSQALVLQIISESFPGDGAVAEEHAADFDTLATNVQRQHVIRYVSGSLGYQVTLEDVRRCLDWGHRKKTERIWTVDPIDGTKGFLRGDQFAIAIALLIEGLPVLAALACPLFPVDPARPDGEKGVLVLAKRKHGATIEALTGGPARPLRVSSLSDVAQARLLESVESGHTDHTFSARLLSVIGGGGQPVRIDSQAKYVALADGRAEVYLRQSPGAGYAEKIWDHAAGAMIVDEAGGRVTDLDGHLLDFSRGERLSANRGILATNSAVHDALLDAVQKSS